MGKFWRENSLSIVLFLMFLFAVTGQAIAGNMEYNEEQQEHGEQGVGMVEYLGTGHFIEAIFENWESEFLQMTTYIALTVFLRQKGSSESKKLEGEEPVDADPRDEKERKKKDAPGPVKQGGLILKLYENSMSIVFFVLFLLSVAMHAFGGVQDYNQEQIAHGGQAISTLEYLGTPRMWFESFQNWQSEFLAIFTLVVFSIFLRQKGSPESKPVAAPHYATGSE
ncbi:MAG: hypothetical protein M3437_10830 [Chloroflexota bacterium]|nr:hypothetical protein [Chloroflexota bacterium]MDQ5866698.1 hypothetical protein [Chloroflexota bacterium]